MKNLFKTILNKPYNFLRNILKSHIENSYGMLIYYNSKEEVLIFDLVRKIKKETEMLLNYQEAYNIYSIVQAVEKIDGDIAEVGVFTGGSAKIMAEAKKTSNKALYLFDTFEGLPPIDVKNDPVKVYGGQFNASYENVKKYLSNYSDVFIYKGLFSDCQQGLENKKFSFVHLDVDLYKSTLAGLEFFYFRMSRGGIIVSHDYLGLPGVKKAFDEFFADKPEVIIRPSRNQCLVVKL